MKKIPIVDCWVKEGRRVMVFLQKCVCVCVYAHTCVQGCTVHLPTYGHTDHNQQENLTSGITSDFYFYH